MTWRVISPTPTVWTILDASGDVRIGGVVPQAPAWIPSLQTGPPGPEGPQGPIGPSGGAGLERVTDVALSGHRCVRATSLSGVNYADTSTPAHAQQVLGITLGAASSGASITVVAAGEVIEPSWSWTPLAPIFAGPGGTLVQTPPVGGWLRVLGFATSPTSMVVQIAPPIVVLP